jgi:hypothetical protein
MERESIEFTVKLNLLLHCLNIFGASSRLQMSYSNDGSPVTLTLEEDGVITECQLATLDVPPQPQFDFRSSTIVGRAVLKVVIYLLLLFIGSLSKDNLS